MMLAAKHAPGRFNVEYVCGMNTSSSHTGIIKSNFNVSQVYNSAGTPALVNLGTDDYTVIMYAPSMSILYGFNGGGWIPASSKVGGLAMF